MVFKGRFFSSKKPETSSPDGSYNSPRSSGSNSNSPVRSDKKKGKSKDNSPSTPTSLSSFASSFKDKKKKDKDATNKGKESPSSVEVKKETAATFKLKKGGLTETTKETAGATASFPLSPIMASSLNKIKTRSGPLPQESFFGYGSSSREKGNALGSSNLSKTVGDGPSLSSGSGMKSLGKKDEKKSVLDSPENAPLRERSPHIPGPSRLQSGESSSGAG